MTIACLGWGSLVWNPESLALEGAWQPDGPSVPVEFSRQSDNGRVTLAITEGALLVTSFWVPIAYDNLGHAKANLAAREGIQPRNIAQGVGFWTQAHLSDRRETAAIGAWAQSRGLDGVVWTGHPGSRTSTVHPPKQKFWGIFLRSLDRRRSTPNAIFAERPNRFGRHTAPPSKASYIGPIAADA